MFLSAVSGVLDLKLTNEAQKQMQCVKTDFRETLDVD